MCSLGTQRNINLKETATMMATRMHELTGATPVALKDLIARGPSDASRSPSANPHISRRVDQG